MRTRPTVGAAVALALAAAGCGGEGGAGPAASTSRAVTPPPPTIVRGERSAADAIQPPPRRLRPVPAAGTVRLADGPFTDRLRVRALSLRRGDRPAITGRVLASADVSEALALTIDVAFYDRAGRLVATGRRSRRDVEEFFDRPLHFRVRASAPAPTAVIGVVSVPEYVPE